MTEPIEKTFEEITQDYDIKYAEANPGLPEAGGVSYCTMYSKTGIALNVTGRGVNPLRALEGLVSAITIAEKRWGLRPEKMATVQASAPVDRAVEIVKEAGGKVEPVYEDALPDAPDGKAWLSFDADIVEVLPQPDDKVDIKFWANGRKYADLMVSKWKIDSANVLMSHVTSEKMNKAAKYNLPCRVYYTEGRAYQDKKGETRHYNDVGAVRPR